MLSDTETWNADMGAWRLTEPQRAHHLRRLRGHHKRLLHRMELACERTDAIQGLLGLALVAGTVVTLALWVAS